MAFDKLKRHKSPGTEQILAEVIKAGGIRILSEIHTFVNSLQNKKQLPEEWKESIIVPIYKKGNKTGFTTYTGLSLLSTTYKMLSKILLSSFNSIYREDYWGTIRVDFNATGQLQIIHSASCHTLDKKWE
jgi:hypothetical protein